MPAKRKGNYRSQKKLEAAAARKDREQQRRDFFAHALEARLTQMGMTQSELAREVNRILPPGVHISRSSISKYVHAKEPSSKPNPVRLAAIAKVLGVDQTQLVPSGRAIDKFLPVDFSATTDGRVHLKINRTFSTKTALAILRLVQEEDNLVTGT
jgi:transcriptional regulator with XRE-family HTH domain